MRHINFFFWEPQNGGLGGGQQVYVEKVYVLFPSPNLKLSNSSGLSSGTCDAPTPEDLLHQVSMHPFDSLEGEKIKALGCFLCIF